MLLAAAWMNMEITILNEVSLSEKDKYHRISLICKIKKKKKNLFTKQKHSQTWRTSLQLLAAKSWGGIDCEFGTDIYILLQLKQITKHDLLYSTGNSAQCHMAAWMAGEFGGEWIHVYVWLSHFAVHLKLSQHC